GNKTGYQGILNNSGSTSTAWTSGIDYKSGASVTYNGRHYVATVSHPNMTQNPAANAAQWRDGETDFKANSRITGQTGGASSTITTKGNAMGTPSQTALSTPITPGTSAEVFGHVTATGDITVRGDDNAGFGGIVGAA